MGTIGYMSPEQVRGTPANPRSDIFSLGCVLYEMISGRRAFEAKTPAETLSSILRDTPADLSTAGNQIPSEIGNLISHCLEKSPEERFQSARDLAFGLKAALSSSADSGVSASAKAANSIAVLPFANASRDPDSEYLSDGITESIINSLVQLSQLRITPRSTVFRYKGRDVDPQAIGHELKSQGPPLLDQENARRHEKRPNGGLGGAGPGTKLARNPVCESAATGGAGSLRCPCETPPLLLPSNRRSRLTSGGSSNAAKNGTGGIVLGRLVPGAGFRTEKER